MENLRIKKTKSSPEVELNSETDIHYIRGELYPENTREFYAPVIEWIREYLHSLQGSAVFNFEIIYFNSSSSKALMDIFYLIDDSVAEDEKEITINWIYDYRNDSAEEYGEEFSLDLEEVPFNLVVKK